MAERRKCELYVVRVVPHALREDSMTVGVVLVEVGDQPAAISHQETPGGTSGPFAECRITRDWKRMECFAPDLELEIFEYLEATIREVLKGHQPSAIRHQESLLPRGAQPNTGEIREQLLEILEARFGALFEVGAAKGLLTEDPVAEMAILERDYLAAMAPVERTRRMGRLGIVARMQDAFAAAGVLELLQRDIEMTEFTGENDPFKVDFGFRVGRSLKMFHGLALSVSREPAVTLAYRYGRIREGMRARGDEAVLTAVISEEAMRAKGEVLTGIEMLRANEVRVRTVDEMGDIVEEVRREVSA